MNLTGNVQMDLLNAGGKISKRLLNANMNPAVLRTNTTLRYDEWKAIDTSVVRMARQRLVIVNALISMGLTYTLPNGMGSTVLQWETQSDMGAAQMTMDGVSRGKKDRPNYEPNYLPIPITHQGFEYSARVLASSRRLGSPLNVTSAEIAARKVSEKIETTFLTGASSFTSGGGTLYGFVDYTNRNTVTLSEQWDHADCTGEDILGMVLDMIESANADNFYGPFILVIPKGYGPTLGDDYKSNSDKSIRSRILELEEISKIVVADYLTAHNVLLIQATSDVVQVVIGMQPTTLEWEEEGGLLNEYKVMAIIVPWIKADQDGNCGIVHMSA